jgi:hypothetical protein
VIVLLAFVACSVLYSFVWAVQGFVILVVMFCVSLYWLSDNVVYSFIWRLGGFSFCVEMLFCLIELSQ